MLSISNVTKLMGGTPLYQNATFQINPGEKVGLVGPNGAGKTTFFRMIVGEENPDVGQISKEAKIKVSYFSQSVGEMSGTTALSEVMSGHSEFSKLQAEINDYIKILEDPNLDEEKMNEVLEKMGDAQTEFDKLGGHEVETKAEEILTGLGIMPEDHHKKVEDFSGGWKMRIALAKVLIVMPDLILMDEPTNYLDMETIIWLEGWLKNFKGAILMTSHDREFMNNIVNKIVEVDRGGVTTYGGNYEFFLKEKEIRKDQNAAEFSRQQSMLKKEEEFIARFQARASHAAQVQSRVKKLEKIDRVELLQEGEEMNILLPEIPRGSNEVVVMKDLAKTWHDSKGTPNQVFSNVTTTIRRQEKVAVVGVNGAGKSTLLKVIIGNTDPTKGDVTIGPSINYGYFGQFSYDNLNPANTVFDELKSRLPKENDGRIRNLLAAFLFKGDEIFKKVKFLSGGEKSRLILAYLLTMPFNLLILDEPTNHLDIKSRENLLKALKDYQGTLMLVSHDRYFLNELTNRVLEVDKGEVHLHPYSYQEYSQRK